MSSIELQSNGSYRIICRADLPGEVESYHHQETPVSGPVPAKTLVTITGIALISLDTDDTLGVRFLNHLDIFIYTNYQVPQKDWIDGATTASLASIQADDSTDVLFAIDRIETEQDAVGLVRVHLTIAVMGDVALNRISFQANILTTRASASLFQPNLDAIATHVGDVRTEVEHPHHG